MDSDADDDSVADSDSDPRVRVLNLVTVALGAVADSSTACAGMSWHVVARQNGNVMKIQLKMAFARFYEKDCRIGWVCVVTSVAWKALSNFK